MNIKIRNSLFRTIMDSVCVFACFFGIILFSICVAIFENSGMSVCSLISYVLMLVCLGCMLKIIDKLEGD